MSAQILRSCLKKGDEKGLHKQGKDLLPVEVQISFPVLMEKRRTRKETEVIKAPGRNMTAQNSEYNPALFQRLIYVCRGMEEGKGLCKGREARPNISFPLITEMQNFDVVLVK